jgi:[ribosomal protein S5]-alanine N-acetyltransferase
MTFVFPELLTGRLMLRKIVAADMPTVFEGLSHPDVIRFYGVSFKTLQETAAQMEFYESLLRDKTGIWWAICFKSEPAKMIGACGFNDWRREHRKTEIGYWLLPSSWGKGIITEALPAITAYAFSHMDLHRIEAVVEQGNNSSAKLLKKLNFTYEGTLADAEIKNGSFISLQYWALLHRQ